MEQKTDKHGTALTDQPHPTPVYDISRDTVLQLLREAGDHWQRYIVATTKLRRELGMDSMSHYAYSILHSALLKIQPVPPEKITSDHVEQVCNLATEARKKRKKYV